MSKRLEGKVAVITGGAHGMGADEARLFAGEGAKVVVMDLRAEFGEPLAKSIGESGGSAIFVEGDVTKEAAWKSCLNATIETFGRLDILVNNAGVGGRFSSDYESLDVWNKVMSVNVSSMFIGTVQAVPLMRRTGGGSIVNISSILGYVGDSRVIPAYTASKGAVRLYTKQAACQFAKDGIRVNSVHPGFMPRMLPPDGGTLEGLEPSEKMVEKELLRVPLGRVGCVREVAHAVLFLASDEASYITGAELLVDGGFLAG